VVVLGSKYKTTFLNKKIILEFFPAETRRRNLDASRGTVGSGFNLWRIQFPFPTKNLF
jgi:hypothetical protein